MSTHDLMARYCDGDEAAFRALYTQAAPRLLGYLKRLTGDTAGAEDLLQHTFLKLHNARGSYVRGADPMKWLFTIAHRTFLDESDPLGMSVNLRKEFGELAFSVSHTTRQPRGHEKEGESYHYLSRDEFERKIRQNEFLEWAEVFDNYYGTHRSILDRAEREGSDVVLDIDVQGAAQLKEKVPGAVSIFVLAPSRATLEKRLRARGEDSDEVIGRRLRDAAREISNYGEYDYVLINSDLEMSAATLCGIVRAERTRRARMESQIRPILASFDESGEGES